MNILPVLILFDSFSFIRIVSAGECNTIKFKTNIVLPRYK